MTYLEYIHNKEIEQKYFDEITKNSIQIFSEVCAHICRQGIQLVVNNDISRIDWKDYN